MTLDPETTRLVKVWRYTIFILVPSMLLWVPCLALSIVFFLNDALYQLTVFDPWSQTSLVEDYRKAGRDLQGYEGFSCARRRAPGMGESDERDPLLRTIEFARGATLARRQHVGHMKYLFVLVPVERLDLGLLRAGAAVDREHGREHAKFDRFESDAIEPYCNAQEARAAEGLALLPPIPAYAQARAILLDAADKMEATLARYAEVRPWLLAFFCAWIAYSLFGFVCAFYVLRLSKRIKERLGQASAADAAPVR